MSAWGIGTFENDSALDWVHDLAEFDDAKFLSETLQAVFEETEDDGFLDSDVGSYALAAAEVVAAARGKPHPELPLEVSEWLESAEPKVDPKLLDLARRAVDKVVTDDKSELRLLWEDAEEEGEFQGWLQAGDDLRARLNA